MSDGIICPLDVQESGGGLSIQVEAGSHCFDRMRPPLIAIFQTRLDRFSNIDAIHEIFPGC